MKKVIGRILPSLLALVLVIISMSVFCPDAQAASKSKKKTKQPSVTAEEENVLAQLVAYRQALVEAGATPESLTEIDGMITAEQNLIAKKQAEAAALAEYQKALAKMNKAVISANPQAAQGVVFVGDSRTCQMHAAVGQETGAVFIAEYSKGYNWFRDTAVPQIDAMAAPGVKIVINLGVNDLGNINRYIELVNACAYRWTLSGAKVYYATVNPIWDNETKTNAMVDNFNAQLITGLVGVGIIDTNTYLKMTGYQLLDNWHYDTATNAKIYLYILSQI